MPLLRSSRLQTYTSRLPGSSIAIMDSIMKSTASVTIRRPFIRIFKTCISSPLSLMTRWSSMGSLKTNQSTPSFLDLTIKHYRKRLRDRRPSKGPVDSSQPFFASGAALSQNIAEAIILQHKKFHRFIQAVTYIGEATPRGTQQDGSRYEELSSLRSNMPRMKHWRQASPSTSPGLPARPTDLLFLWQVTRSKCTSSALAHTQCSCDRPQEPRDHTSPHVQGACAHPAIANALRATASGGMLAGPPAGRWPACSHSSTRARDVAQSLYLVGGLQCLF